MLTRPFSHIYKAKDTSPSSLLSENITALTPLYVFTREDLDFSDPKDTKGWYQVGETAAGNPVGWMHANDVVEWRQTLIVAFTHPGVGKEARKSVILFDTRNALNGVTSLDDSARKAKADELYQSIQAAVDKHGAAPEGVISVEPGPFIDIKEKFYMLPVLQFEDLGSRFTDESRHLQVMAVVQTRRMATAQAASTPSAAGELSAAGIQEDVAKLGAATIVPYLGNETPPPRDIVAWAFDRDLVDPRLPALQMRVLLNREQVNNLVFTAEKVSQALQRAQLTQMQFWEADAVQLHGAPAAGRFRRCRLRLRRLLSNLSDDRWFHSPLSQTWSLALTGAIKNTCSVGQPSICLQAGF